MRNPLRSEGEAYRFLLVTIAAFAATAVASVLGGWKAGLPVFVVAAAAVVWWVAKTGEPGEREPRVAPASPHAPGERRVLVLASPGAAADPVRERLDARGDVGEVVVLVPALASPVEQLTGAVDDRRAEAQARADALAAQLGGDGARVRAEVGADEPLQAIEDAIRLFGADEIVLAGGDEQLEQAARERFAMPVARA